MRWITSFIPTIKEVPREADTISHKLLLRAGFIRKLSSGLYEILPLGYKVIRKIENIVREEMEKADAVELLLPILSPQELWHKTGRWELYGKELMRVKDRHNRQFALGPTHEEVITDLVSREVRSYRDLPVNLYQIQLKFRDEIRPRFGIMRAREFIMKDSYSFDIDEKHAEVTYQKMIDAYTRIFTRCGLKFKMVEADTGAIGGSFSHEFMVLANTGEEAIISCSKCNYSANREKAQGFSSPELLNYELSKFKPKKVFTPKTKSVKELSKLLKCKEYEILKTLLYKNNGKFIIVLLRGDHELNVNKLNKLIDSDAVMLSREEVKSKIGCSTGFVGPIGLKNKLKDIVVIADNEVLKGGSLIVGANETDYHLLYVNPKRDLKIDKVGDIKLVNDGDVCVKCGAMLKMTRGIEVAHAFKLGYKYSKLLNATYTDEKGKKKLIVMGCYGIGISRTMAASVEQNNDENGIIWPMAISPAKVLILPIDITRPKIKECSEKLYNEFKNKGIEVILDDRLETAGKKFKDADLIGIPVKLIVGDKFLKQSRVEVKTRDNKISKLLKVSDVFSFVADL